MQLALLHAQTSPLARGRHGYALRARATARAPQSSLPASQGRLAVGRGTSGPCLPQSRLCGGPPAGPYPLSPPPSYPAAAPLPLPPFSGPSASCLPGGSVGASRSHSRCSRGGGGPGAVKLGAGSRHTAPTQRRGSGLCGRRSAAVRGNLWFFGRRERSPSGELCAVSKHDEQLRGEVRLTRPHKL